MLADGAHYMSVKWLIRNSTLAHLCRLGWGRPSHWSTEAYLSVDRHASPGFTTPPQAASGCQVAAQVGN